MATLEIEREFSAAPEKVFDFITRTEHLTKWWGPEGMHVPEHDLDLSKTGVWFSVMENKEGQQYKVSGEVLQVDPPNAVEFTWAWHDEGDVRGNESTVRFEVTANTGGGTLFKLIQTGLSDDEAAQNHKMGWESSFNKLEKLAS